MYDRLVTNSMAVNIIERFIIHADNRIITEGLSEETGALGMQEVVLIAVISVAVILFMFIFLVVVISVCTYKKRSK